MGADYIGWRDCPLQRELGRDGFLGKLKLRAYRSVVESRVPPEKRASLQIRVVVTGREPRDLVYADLLEELAAFEAGIAECATCPLAREGQPLDCYRYVTYPVDETFEQVVFEFFKSQLETPDSICRQIYDDLVCTLAPGYGWYEPRGSGHGTLAEREEPLVWSFRDANGEHAVDSAQILACLFISLHSPAMVVAYARFWGELLGYAGRIAERLQMRDDRIEVPVYVDDCEDADGIADLATLPIRVHTSRTLREIRDVYDLLLRSMDGALEKGWEIVVDS
jgi:hypothetical protein